MSTTQADVLTAASQAGAFGGGVFDAYAAKAWPYHYKGTILVSTIAGGTPTDPKVAEGWLRSKLVDKGDDVRSMAAQIVIDRGVSLEEATKIIDELQHLNGFKRDPERGLYIEGRQLKAALKEATSVAIAADKLEMRGWGKTNKGLLSFVAEHIVVMDDRLYLDRTEAEGIMQRFVHTFRGNGIQYEEYCTNVSLDFTVVTDYEFTNEQWAMIWLTGGPQGIGASRAQGYGRYKVTRWEQVDPE